MDDKKLPCLRILKTAWCSSARTSESDIYLSIEKPNPRGLAEFECGGDVRFPRPAGFPITVQNLRGNIHHTVAENLDKPTSVLHRFILRTVGRPLWDYTSDRDLLTGFHDALKGACLFITGYRHLSLPSIAQGPRGILHRYTSAGNILLAEKKVDDGPCGFITDSKFDRIQGSTLRRRPVITSQHTTFESNSAVKRGAGMMVS